MMPDGQHGDTSTPDERSYKWKGYPRNSKMEGSQRKCTTGLKYNANPLQRRKTIERRLMIPFYAE